MPDTPPSSDSDSQIQQEVKGDRNQTIGQVLGGMVVYGQVIYNNPSVELDSSIAKPEAAAIGPNPYKGLLAVYGQVIYNNPSVELDSSIAKPEAAAIGPNPYKGLLAFQETDGDRFFGRAPQIEALWEKFRGLHEEESAVRLLPIYGPSGSGKSSLARAGLIPELARRPLPGRDCALVAVLVPGTHPLGALAAVLARIATNDLTPVAKTREFAEELAQKNADGEYDGLRRIADVLPEIEVKPLIVLADQLEEVYTLCKDEAERSAFIGNLLCAASERSKRVSVIVTLRSDFLGETQKYSLLNRLLSEQGFLVPAMDKSELRDAIRKPAEQAGHALDESTIRELVEQTEGREGILPLLQFALEKIWKGLLEGKEPALTLNEIGGVGGALAGEAKRIYTSLNTNEQKIARRVFLGLVQLAEGSKDTRRRTNLRQLISHRDNPEEFKQVIARFAAPGTPRLITLASDGEAGSETAEVTHEALFNHWDQLKRWLNRKRSLLRFQRRLDEAAMYWDKNEHPEGNLWRSPDLDYLKEFHEQSSEEMTPLQIKFFNASVEFEKLQKLAVEKSARDKRILRKRIFVFLATTLFFTIGLLIFALFQLREAQRQKAKQFEANSAVLLSSQPVDAVINAIAAYGLNQNTLVQFPDKPDMETTKSILLDAIRENHEQKRFLHNNDKFWSVAFSPDGTSVVSGSSDHTAQIWNIKTGKLKCKIFKDHNKKDDADFDVSSVAFSNKEMYIVSGSNDHTVRIWDKECKPIHNPLGSHEDKVTSVAFSPNDESIVSGSRDKTVRIWKIGEHVGRTLKGHQDKVWSVAFSPDGNRIVSGSSDRTVRIWDAKTGRLIHTRFPLKHEDAVTSVSFSPDNKSIVSGGNDNTVRIWDAKTGKLLHTLLGHEGEVKSVAFSTDGMRIVSGGSDGTIRIWDAKTAELISKLLGHNAEAWSVKFSHDGKRLVSGSSDNTVRIWNADTQKFSGHTLSITDLHTSSDGKYIVSSSRDKTVRIWNSKTGETIETKKFDDDIVTSVAFGSNEKQIVVGSRNGKVRIWDRGKNKSKPLELKGHKAEVWSVAFNDARKLIVSGSKDNTVRIWNAVNGAFIGTLEGHIKDVNSVAFSTDGEQIISGSDDKTICIWNVKTHKCIPISGKDADVNSVIFSPDGTKIASGSKDGKVRIWDWNKETKTATFRFKTIEGHNAEVRSIAFSPDGTRLVSGSSDKTVRIWNTVTGKPIGTPFKGHINGVMSVAFSPDGQLVFSGSRDKTIRIWNILDNPLKVACNQLRNQPSLIQPKTDVAREAKHTCEQYAWK
jgi:WD40 repeat protein